MCVVVGISLCV